MTAGKCNCGTVQVDVTDLAQRTNGLCSCTSCRASCGSIFSVNIITPTTDFNILAGKDNISTYRDSATDTGHTALRTFCKTCGSPISTQVEEAPEVHYVKGGLFPPGSLPAPKAELFKRNWEEWQGQHGGKVACFDANPPSS